MAHHVSPECLRARLMDSPLAQWRGWTIHAACRPAEHKGSVLMETILGQPDPPQTVSGLVDRLRCQLCEDRQGRPETVALQQGCDWVAVIGYGTGRVVQGEMDHRRLRAV
jgi:hypothetical protein